MFKWINNSLYKKDPSTSSAPPSARAILADQFKGRNLAGEILELQFQCESEASSAELIAELNELYMQAVGYYESENDRRYLVYQKRLESFLKKQNIDEVLRGKPGRLANKKDVTEKEILSARIKSRGEVAQIIERSEKMGRINQTKLIQTLSEQEHQLSKRIRKRRTMSNCSTRTKDDEDEIEEARAEAGEARAEASRSSLLDELFSKKEARVKRVLI